jgi:hypothetical protein
MFVVATTSEARKADGQLTWIPGKRAERGSNAPAVMLTRANPRLQRVLLNSTARGLKRNPDNVDGETAMTCGSSQGLPWLSMLGQLRSMGPGKQPQGICPGHAIDVASSRRRPQLNYRTGNRG